MKIVSDEGYELELYDISNWGTQKIPEGFNQGKYTLAPPVGEYKTLDWTTGGGQNEFVTMTFGGKLRITIYTPSSSIQRSIFFRANILSTGEEKTTYWGEFPRSVTDSVRALIFFGYFEYKGKEYVFPVGWSFDIGSSQPYQCLYDFTPATKDPFAQGMGKLRWSYKGGLYFYDTADIVTSDTPQTTEDFLSNLAQEYRLNLLDYVKIHDDNPLPPAPDPDEPIPPIPPAPAPLGYGKFRYSLYRIPFMRDGLDIATVAAGAVESTLAGYRIAEYITEEPFRDEQGTIVFNDGATANGANYLRVARTASDTVGDYSQDALPLYFWVESVELLAEPEATPAVLSISRDAFMSDLMQMSADDRKNVFIEGELVATTEKPLNVRDDMEKQPLITPEYVGQTPNFYPAISDRKFAVVLCGTDTNGNTFQCAIPSTDTSGDEVTEITELQNNISIASTAIAYRVKSNNISVQRVYVIPQSWADVLSLSGDYDLFYKDDSDEKTVKVKIFSGEVLHKTATVVGEYSPEPPAQSNFTFYPFTRLFFKTPARTLEITADTSIEQNRKVTIYAAVSFRGAGANGLTFYALINGEFVDISDDFTADFAVNAEALRQAQQSELTALRTISAAVGAIGGTVGGISSGNYFGAVQSAVSGVSSIAQIAAAKRTPATMRNGGSAMNGIFELGEICFITVQPKNETELLSYAENFGYLYPSKPHVYFGIPELEPPHLGAYYRLENAKITGLKQGGQSSMKYIAARLEEGIRFRRM